MTPASPNAAVSAAETGQFHFETVQLSSHFSFVLISDFQFFDLNQSTTDYLIMDSTLDSSLNLQKTLKNIRISDCLNILGLSNRISRPA